MAEKKPNNRFREARERTQSLASPEECLSRQEVAELANAWVWKHRHKKFELNVNYIGKLERGVICWPSALCREAFRAIFNVSKDSELGFVNARARSPRPVLLGSSEPTPVPVRVGASDIERVRSITQEFRSWSRAYGSVSVRDAVMAQLRWSAGLLEASCPERLHPELFSAVGDLAAAAGYLALDAGTQDDARRALGFALGCAEQAEDWPLRANVLATMTAQAIWTGQPDEGLTWAELALVRPDRLAPIMLAMLHTGRARALAKMRRVQEVLRAIGTADEHFAHSTPDNDPPFMDYYTTAHHNQLTGKVLANLAILDRDPGEATTRLTAAAAGHATGRTRSRAICLTKLASLTMATGDPLQAATLGHEALDITGSIRSHLAAEQLRELSRYAAVHQNLEEVEHLRQQIATLVCTDNPS